jgi:hypothetical protein
MKYAPDAKPSQQTGSVVVAHRPAANNEMIEERHGNLLELENQNDGKLRNGKRSISSL